MVRRLETKLTVGPEHELSLEAALNIVFRSPDGLLEHLHGNCFFDRVQLPAVLCPRIQAGHVEVVTSYLSIPKHTVIALI